MTTTTNMSIEILVNALKSLPKNQGFGYIHKATKTLVSITDIEGACGPISKLATTSSTGGLSLALQRPLLLLAPKGGIASTFTGPL